MPSYYANSPEEFPKAPPDQTFKQVVMAANEKVWGIYYDDGYKTKDLAWSCYGPHAEKRTETADCAKEEAANCYKRYELDHSTRNNRGNKKFCEKGANHTAQAAQQRAIAPTIRVCEKDDENEKCQASRKIDLSTYDVNQAFRWDSKNAHELTNGVNWLDKLFGRPFDAKPSYFDTAFFNVNYCYLPYELLATKEVVSVSLKVQDRVDLDDEYASTRYFTYEPLTFIKHDDDPDDDDPDDDDLPPPTVAAGETRTLLNGYQKLNDGYQKEETLERLLELYVNGLRGDGDRLYPTKFPHPEEKVEHYGKEAWKKQGQWRLLFPLLAHKMFGLKRLGAYDLNRRAEREVVALAGFDEVLKDGEVSELSDTLFLEAIERNVEMWKRKMTLPSGDVLKTWTFKKKVHEKIAVISNSANYVAK
jgi:hypothetical protein